MYSKLVVAVSAVLVLALGSMSYGIVIGNWENDMEGWEICNLNPPGNPVLSYSETGATLDANSLRMEVPLSGWKFALIFKLQNAGLTEEFFRHNIFSIDVTRLASEWTGSDGFTQLILIVNAAGGVWDDYGAAGNWSAPDGDNTQTVTWDYSESIPKIAENAGYVEFVIVTNYSNLYTTGGVYYLDNAQLLGSGDVRAHEPNPADGETDVQREPTLTWGAGILADTHDVYFGTSFNDVNDASIDVHQNVTVAQLDVNSYSPGVLDFNKTYYWRVDEVNEPDIWEGSVWNFTVGNFLVLDDMEAYNDIDPGEEGSNRIYEAWKDGYEIPENGSLSSYDYPPLAELTIVHGGYQAMPFFYDTDFKYAEVKKTLSDRRDWTEEGMKALSIWFYGDPNNFAEQMYVAVANSTGPAVTVNHPDPAASQIAGWQQWDIDLKQFEDGGIDLTDVNSIAIGFSDRDNPQAGGTGKVIFDDIRLYPPRCILSERSAEFAKIDFAPAGDPAGDCVIDYRELAVLVRDWLVEDEVVATALPGTSGLVAYYPLNEGAGDTAVDASGSYHDGTLSYNASWNTSGLMGTSAVRFDGSAGTKIDIGSWDPASGTGQLTLSLWVKWLGSHAGSDHQGLIGKRDDWEAEGLKFMFEVDTTGGNDALGFRQYTDANTDVYSENGLMTAFIGRWVHVAVTFDGTTAVIYLNGRQVASGPFTFGGGSSASMAIGNTNGSVGWDNSPEVFNGDLDEIRIYNRALSAAQVAYLADTTPADGQLNVTVPSPAELYEAEAEGIRSVNLSDFAVLADKWLDEMLWP